MTPAGQGARTLTYDALQNLTSDGVNTFGFDLENRMLSASKAGMSAVYTYDPLGRRVAKSVNGVGTATLFDGDSEIGDLEGGVYVRRYVPGPGIDAPVAIREGAGWVWPRRDRLGSVIARTSSAGLSGSAVTYDPYGTSAQASAAAGGFLFTGRRYDAETGLYYIRARMYSPALGRFLQTDPVGYADQMNLYAYVGNDPGNATDPTGKCPVCIGFVIGAGVDLAVQLATRKPGEKINLVQVAISGAATASGVGAARLFGQLGLSSANAIGANMAANGVINAAAGAATNLSNGEKVDRNLAENTALGVVGGLAGGLAEEASSAVIKGSTIIGEEGVLTSAGRSIAQGASDLLSSLTSQTTSMNESAAVGTNNSPIDNATAVDAAGSANSGPLRVRICSRDPNVNCGGN